ncbi:hypothetical protein [Brevibacillus daliensis]|uniref:hypothetical protein n=1 Tax=Brevibacillus daliensis TaxID=2892995 RepID=UPI001E5C9A15|nr:hypothetical protein [Brevibacillus daliensis]
MKKKWIVGLASVLVLSSATVAFGEAAVRLYLNGERNSKINVAGTQIEAAQELATSLGAFASYDKETGKLFIEKPNVNIMVLEGIQQLKNKDILLSNPVTGWLEKDIPRNFGVFVEVDNITDSKEMMVKINILGPDNQVVDASKERSYSVRDGGFYFSQPFVSTKLSKIGTYRVQVVMKNEKNDEWIVVGENTFTVGK